MTTNSEKQTTRRDFLKTSAVLGGAIMAPAILPSRTFAAGNSDTIKVGLVGCGGRGTGAATQALRADKNVVLTAMGDAFPDQLEKSLNNLRAENDLGDKLKVDEGHKFVGLDAYQKVIDSGVDVVLLATPPIFRPTHLKAAVAAGKHIFCEKPVATDAPGVRSVMESVAESKKKSLCLVAGFCWRYNLAEQALFERILGGDIGEIRAAYGTYYTGPVHPIPPESDRKPDMSDLEWQLRYWQNFCWTSGDSLVEQAVHAVDWLCWAMKETPPVKAVAVGGRQVASNGGNIFDHFEVNYEYANGARGFLGSRQQPGCYNNNNATFFGTEGTAHEMGFATVPYIKGKKSWSYRGPRPDMYQIEHNHLFKAIRDGNAVNDGDRLASSTLVAIMGRMAAYTGQEITWDMALNSKESLLPEKLSWEAKLPVAARAIPGETKFI
jgi:predicted dehydrogenase